MHHRSRLALLVLFGATLHDAAQGQRTPREVVDAAATAASAGTLGQFRQRWQARDASTDRRLQSLALGSAARLSYQFADAARLLIAAEGDTLAADELTARAALGRASIALQQFNLRDASTMLLRTRRLAVIAGARDVDAEAMLHLVAVRQRLLGVPAALATADSAALLLPARDTLLRTELACRRAQARVRAGDPTALADAQRAAMVAARLDAPRLEGLCWQAVGQSHQMRDELRDARAAFGTAAERHAAAHDLAGVAAALQWHAFFQRILGQFDSAQVDYRSAIDAGTRSGNRAPVAWSWLGLAGLSAAAGEPVRAAEEAQRAGRMMTELGDRWGLAAASNLAGIAAERLGDLPRAKNRLREAIARSDSLGATSDVLSPGVRLIDVERQLDGEPAALARVRWVDSVAERTGIPGWQGQRWYSLALLSLQRGDGAEALDRLRRFEATFQPGDSSVMPGFDFAVRVAEARALAGDPLRAARDLGDAIEAFARWRRRLADRALRLAIWEQRALDSDADLGVATIIARAAQAGHDSLAFRLADARRARDLRTKLASSSGPRVLRAGQVHLQYVTGLRGEPTTLFMRRGVTLASAQLPPIDSLARRIAAFTSLLSGDAPARSLARELGEVLLGPATSLLDSTITELLIVPDGALHAVPWSALQVADGSALGDRVAITIMLSGAASATVSRARPASVVAVAADSSAALWDGRVLPPLPRASEEASRIARGAAGGRALIGRDATEHAVKQLTAQPLSILHLAAHAVVDERSNARAAVVLRAGDGDDGLLEAHEIAALRLPAALVVLAGCSTASGRVFAGEGVQGLVRPLLDAGASGVIASQWPVRDASAHRVMQWFYAGLSRGLTTATALQHAQRQARSAGLPTGDWAGWVYVGDPDARPPVTLSSATFDTRVGGARTAAAFALLLIAAGAVYLITTRRAALRA